MSNNAVWIQIKTVDWSEWKGQASDKNVDTQWKNWVEEMKSWPEIERVWSTSGQWDWIVQLNSQASGWDEAKKIVWQLKERPWVSDTNTWWSEEL